MKKTILSSLFLLLLGISIFWMCGNVVWLGDDLDYKYMMKGEIWQSWGKIKTVKQFFDSQWIHYQHVNGRFVAHALVQLFNAKLGQTAFSICNAIIYVLFAFLLGKAGKVRFKENPGGILSAICISVLCFITKMMPTCQIGYIWAMTANLAWLMLYFKIKRPNWITSLLMLLFGIIVGNWQESVSLGVCCGVGLWWIYQLSACFGNKGEKFDWHRSWMLLGYVAGTASNCFAPSTIGRVSDIDMVLTDQFLIASYSFPAIVLLFLIVVQDYIKRGYLRLLEFKNEYCTIPYGVLSTGIIFLVVFNLAIGVYSNRQLFGANLFAAILLLSILPRHRFNLFFNSLATILVLAFWTLMAIGMSQVSNQYDKIVHLHLKSVDGSIYLDRTRVMTLGFPLRAKYYEDILGQFDNDLHHSMMKDFKHTRKGCTLKLKPTSRLDKEGAYQYAPGHFNVTLREPPKGEASREIIVYGHYPIPWIKAAPRKIEVKKYSKRMPPYSEAVIIPEFPFFRADSIRILP